MYLARGQRGGCRLSAAYNILDINISKLVVALLCAITATSKLESNLPVSSFVET
jgi:hypothetical protein